MSSVWSQTPVLYSWYNWKSCWLSLCLLFFGK